MANIFDKFVTIMNSKEPSVVKALGRFVFSAFKQETHVWINLLIEIRFTINFIISNFYLTLSYLCPRWILYAIFFIYYDFTDILARCTIVHCFYHVCMNVCDSWVFKDSFVSIKLLSIYLIGRTWYLHFNDFISQINPILWLSPWSPFTNRD